MNPSFLKLIFLSMFPSLGLTTVKCLQIVTLEAFCWCCDRYWCSHWGIFVLDSHIRIWYLLKRLWVVSYSFLDLLNFLFSVGHIHSYVCYSAHLNERERLLWSDKCFPAAVGASRSAPKILWENFPYSLLSTSLEANQLSHSKGPQVVEWTDMWEDETDEGIPLRGEVRWRPRWQTQNLSPHSTPH